MSSSSSTSPSSSSLSNEDDLVWRSGGLDRKCWPASRAPTPSCCSSPRLSGLGTITVNIIVSGITVNMTVSSITVNVSVKVKDVEPNKSLRLQPVPSNGRCAQHLSDLPPAQTRSKRHFVQQVCTSLVQRLLACKSFRLVAQKERVAGKCVKIFHHYQEIFHRYQEIFPLLSGSISPLSGNISPFSGNISPLSENISPLSGLRS